MANDLNQCNFIGRAGRDVETRFTPSGMMVATVSIAVGHKYKGEEKTEWVNITAFGKLAEIFSEYVTKGKQIFVSGRMQTDQWEDKEGNKRRSTKIIADKLQLLGGSSSRDEYDQRPQVTNPAEDIDDIAF